MKKANGEIVYDGPIKEECITYLCPLDADDATIERSACLVVYRYDPEALMSDTERKFLIEMNKRDGDSFVEPGLITWTMK